MKKLMTSQAGIKTNAIHILPKISNSKDNQTIKFDQLIEYIIRRTFLEGQMLFNEVVTS